MGREGGDRMEVECREWMSLIDEKKTYLLTIVLTHLRYSVGNKDNNLWSKHCIDKCMLLQEDENRPSHPRVTFHFNCAPIQSDHYLAAVHKSHKDEIQFISFLSHWEPWCTAFLSLCWTSTDVVCMEALCPSRRRAMCEITNWFGEERTEITWT